MESEGSKIPSLYAGEIKIKSSIGKVKGSLLSEKIFLAKTSTGSVRVPQTTSGGMCEVATSTGDIQITVENQKQKSNLEEKYDM